MNETQVTAGETQHERTCNISTNIAFNSGSYSSPSHVHHDTSLDRPTLCQRDQLASFLSAASADPSLAYAVIKAMTAVMHIGAAHKQTLSQWALGQ